MVKVKIKFIKRKNKNAIKVFLKKNKCFYFSIMENMEQNFNFDFFLLFICFLKL